MRNTKNGIKLFRIVCGCFFILSILSYASRFASGWISLCSLIFLPVALLNLVCAGIACSLKPRRWAWISFLGFGLSPEQPAIGVILSEAMGYLTAGAWWLAVFPGVALVFVVLLFDRAAAALRRLVTPQEVQL